MLQNNYYNNITVFKCKQLFFNNTYGVLIILVEALLIFKQYSRDTKHIICF